MPVELVIAGDSDAEIAWLTRFVPARWVYAGTDAMIHMAIRQALTPGNTPFLDPTEYTSFMEESRRAMVEAFEPALMNSGDDWSVWANDCFSRNPYEYDAFLDYAYLRLLKEDARFQEGQNYIFVFKNRAALSIARRIARERGFTIHASPFSIRGFFADIRKRVKRVAAYLHAAISFAAIWVIAQLAIPRRPAGSGNPILIRTYVRESDLQDDGTFQDRYLAALIEHMRSTKTPYSVFPILHGIQPGTAKSVFEKMGRNSADSFILPHHHLTMADLAFAMLHPLHRKSAAAVLRPVHDPVMRGILSFAYPRTACSTSTMHALLHLRVIGGMKRNGIAIGQFITFFENQPINKADARAIRGHYPDAVITGVHAIVPPVNMTSLFATKAEAAAGLTPHRFVVPGKSFVGIYSQFNPEGCYLPGPSLRYGYLWKTERARLFAPRDRELAVLVTLPQSIGLSVNILSVVAPLLNAAPSGVSFIIKNHPTVPVRTIIAHAARAGIAVKAELFTDTPMERMAGRYDVLISAESGTLLEAVCMGIPALEIGQTFGVDFSPFIPKAAQSLYRKVYATEECREALFEWALKEVAAIPASEREQRAAAVTAECFEPNTPELMSAFIRN